MTKSQIQRLSNIYLNKIANNDIGPEELKILSDMILALDKNQKDKEIDLDWNVRVEELTKGAMTLIHGCLMRTGVPNFTVINGGEGKND